jgi:iron complex transport system substrate-binding protein
VLFAIGAGDQVVAVDDQSDFPDDAPTTDLSGYEPNLEAIIGYEPDLVVSGPLADDIVSGLEAVGAEVVIQDAAATLDDTYDQIAELGIATGHEDEAAEVVAEMRAEIDRLAATVPEREVAPTYYHELDDTLYSVTSSTFIGQLYALAGLENIADAADPDGALGGYPQLSAEMIVAADPDFVFLADTECCGQTAETLAARPGFGGLTAIAEGNVVELDDDVASRWGPRVVELLATIIEATATVPVG